MNKLKNRLKRNFSQLPNQLILDMNLSHPAYRIVTYLFSLPDGWEVNNKDIQRRFKIKTKDTMGNYWREIIDSGWVTRERRRNEKGNIIGGYEYTIHPEPITHSQADPDPADPEVGANPTHNNKDLSNNTDTEQQQPFTDDELHSYIQEKGFQGWINPVTFCEYYSNRNWTTGKGKNQKPMKSWKLAVCNWVDRQKQFAQANQSNAKANGNPSAGYKIHKTTKGLLDD